MWHVIKQTHDEKIAMYMKLTKRELAEMLANCNEALSARAAVEPVKVVQTTIGWPPNISWNGVG